MKLLNETYVSVTLRDVEEVYARMSEALKAGRIINLKFHNENFFCEICKDEEEGMVCLVLGAEDLPTVLAASMKGFIEDLKKEQN